MPETTFIASSAQTMFSNATTTTGLGNWIGESNDANSVRRGMSKFDISSIPEGSTINSATLRFYANQNKSNDARTASAYRIKRLIIINQNTWANYSSGNAWQTAGGTGANDIDTTAIGTRAYSSSETLNEFKDFSLTASKIQEMITGGTFSNTGTAMFLTKMATEAADAYDHDGHAEGNPPQLVIDYTPLPTAGSGMFLSM